MDHLAARGLTCPQPVRNRRRQRARAAGRPARRRSSPFSTASRCAARRRAIARAVGGALARLHVAGAISRCAAERARRSPAGRPCSRPREARADTVAPGLAARPRRELAHPEAAWPPSLPTGSSTPTSSPTTCSSCGDTALRADRLLFRLHRRARLRPRDLPERLVLRAGRLLQRDQGPGADRRLREGPAPRCAEEVEALPILRAARRCASC